MRPSRGALSFPAISATGSTGTADAGTKPSSTSVRSSTDLAVLACGLGADRGVGNLHIAAEVSTWPAVRKSSPRLDWLFWPSLSSICQGEADDPKSISGSSSSSSIDHFMNSVVARVPGRGLSLGRRRGLEQLGACGITRPEALSRIPLRPTRHGRCGDIDPGEAAEGPGAGRAREGGKAPTRMRMRRAVQPGHKGSEMAACTSTGASGPSGSPGGGGAAPTRAIKVATVVSPRREPGP